MSFDTLLAKTSYVIFRPGGIVGGVVVTTWAQVQEFIALRQGTVVVYVDDSIVSPALVPTASGVTDCENRVEIRSFRQDELNFTTLVVQDGATLKNLYKISSTMVVLGDTQGATPAFDWDYIATVVGVPGPVLFIEHAFIGSTAAATQPCITIAAGHLLEFNISEMGGVSQGGASSIISVAGQFQAFLWAAELLGPGFTLPIGTNWVSGAGQVFLQYDTDTTTASQTVLPTTATTNTLVLLDAQFGSVIYRPGAATSGMSVGSWAEVQQYIKSHTGSVIVYVDDRLVSPALVPGATGITDCQGRVELRPFAADSVLFSILQIENGAQLLNLYKVSALDLRSNCQGVLPSLDWNLTPTGGSLYLEEFAQLSNAATATNPMIVVSAGKNVSIDSFQSSFLMNAPGVPLFNVAALTSTLGMVLLDSALPASVVSGPGTFIIGYDNVTAFGFTPSGTVPAQPGVGTYSHTNLDSIWETKPLDPVTMGAPNVNDVPHFDGTKWVAGPVPASSILSEQTIAASGVFAPGTVDVLVFVDTTGGPVNLTLPAPVAGVATRYTFKDSKQNFNVNALTLVPPGAVLIEDVNANFVISAQGAHVTVISDGANYFV